MNGMSVEAVFKFVANNPPSALIAGGILFAVLSVITAPFDPSSTEFLRGYAPWMIGGGFILQVVWLVLRAL